MRRSIADRATRGGRARPPAASGARRGGRAIVPAALVGLVLACREGSDTPGAAQPATQDRPAGGTEPPARAPDVLYVPTPDAVVDRMLDLARVREHDVVYDLGAGDGRIVVRAAERHGARGVGFELDPALVAEARRNAAARGVDHLVHIEQRDIFELDLSPASVVTLYLLPELNVRLLPQLERMKPGARIVSHDFDIAGVIPSQRATVPVAERGGERLTPHALYLFELPLRREP